MAQNADTSAYPYLGVWAPDAAACETVDKADGDFTVITKVSLRVGTELSLTDAVTPKDGAATLVSGDKTFVIIQSGPDQISVNARALVRCTLP